jgi:hypothetical protein
MTDTRHWDEYWAGEELAHSLYSPNAYLSPKEEVKAPKEADEVLAALKVRLYAANMSNTADSQKVFDNGTTKVYHCSGRPLRRHIRVVVQGKRKVVTYTSLFKDTVVHFIIDPKEVKAYVNGKRTTVLEASAY